MIERLLETIKIQDGIMQNSIYHNQRFNKTRNHFWPNSTLIDLSQFIKIPEQFRFGTIRCRVLYTAEIEEIQFIKYSYAAVNTLKIVETEIDYRYKWENRSELNSLVAANPNYDDILLVKNGFIADTSHANIILKKNNEFFTPKLPILKGTKRQHLIDEDIIIERNIKPADLKKFTHFAIINAFNDFDLTKFIPIKNIFK